MDILAKHIPIDEKGVQIAKLDEMSYRRLLWSHRPLTDFGELEKAKLIVWEMTDLLLLIEMELIY